MNEVGHPSRVLQVHTRYRRPGGEDTVVDNLTRALSRAGVRADVFSAQNPTGAATIPALAKAVWNNHQARLLTQELQSYKPDVIHIHNTWFAMTPSVVEAAHQAAPVVMTLHNYRLTCANAALYRVRDVCERCVEGSAWTGLWLNCYRDPLSSAIAAANIAIHRKRDTWNDNVDRFFALSRFAVDLFVKAGLDRKRIQVVNNYVNDPGPRPTAPSHSDYALYVGRLSEEKGVADLADRWIRFGPVGLDLVICGDGPLRATLPESRTVKLMGWIQSGQLTELMLNARALIFPSKWYEGQPLTILEAFASGLPVLGSRLGAAAELLGFLGPEWLANPNDDQEWYEGFQLLATDAVDRASTLVRGQFLEHHTEGVVIDQVLEGYRQAVEDRSQRDP